MSEPRVKCPVCGTMVSAFANGRVRRHSRFDVEYGTKAWGKPCPGTDVKVTPPTKAEKDAMRAEAQDIVAKIDAHLKRIERDPKLNPTDPKYKVRQFYCASASLENYNSVRLLYVAYQGDSHVTRDDAARYLAWLDAGNVGTHHTLEHRAKREADSAAAPVVTETTVHIGKDDAG